MPRAIVTLGETKPILPKLSQASINDEDQLVEGEALELWSYESLGLFSQCATIGFIQYFFSGLQYPLYNVYLQMEGYQTASYNVLLEFGWTFKVVFGMLTDCVAIFGYRRKSWMLIGWSLTMVSLTCLAMIPLGEPYCNREKTTYCSTPFDQVPASEMAYFNVDAPNQGTFFILVSMFTSVGYVTADCAADAMMVEYAQHERMATRGRVQTMAYLARYLGGVFGLLLIAFGFNGANYNGSFSYSLTPNTAFGLCLVPCGLVCMSVVCLVKERLAPATPFRTWCSNFWSLLQEQATWQICAYSFLSSWFQGMATTAQSPLATYWAHVEPLNDSLSQIMGNLITAAVFAVVSRWGLNWNWRWTIAIASISVVLIDGSVAFLTIWDVVRNQWFYTGVALADNVPGGVLYIVSTFCAVEIADVGNEGATYGLVTTVSNLADPFSTFVYKYLDSYFAVNQDDIKSDSDDVRRDVTTVYVISYVFKLVALVWLCLLPPQKAQLHHLKRHGSTSRLAGVLLIALYIASLLLSFTSNLLSIYPATKCFRLAGGDGKVGPDGLCHENN
ncbi:Aste57867_23787 [Aphanomyces stellatus]|uniref:Aste57867_23787 protein n=1 Tax=Aphanomyces stellatus TaxID=120398 RepID=A0A485LPF1_9STRA|nr:hypothetical protein As57867_023714 [Aphanomyces stellatus]VFU00432.1 Aste57867_23787 [Aphanomyces stellatus]